MYGGLRERTNLALVLAVVGLFSAKATPVLSADLGGDCCADLEERVAELEATTTRKGTRNVNDAEGAAIFLSQFFLRSGGQFIQAGDGFPLRWTDALRGFNNSTPGDSGRRNVVRYDAPTFHGFTGIVAWGEDDLWDVAL